MTWQPSGPPTDDISARAELAGDYPILDQWRQRVRTPAGLHPSPTSAIAVDDAAWSYEPLSAQIGVRLTSAVDQLQALRVLCEADSWHPSASFTLTRSALLSASEALWLMDPNQVKRQQRGIHLAGRDLRHRLDWLRRMAKGSGIIWEKASVARGHISLRDAGLNLVRDQGVKIGPSRGGDVIESAAQWLERDLTVAGWAEQAMSLWHSTSSDAHGSGWSIATRRPTIHGPAPGGLHVMSSGGSPLYTWHAWHVAFVTTRFGWRICEELSAPIGVPPRMPTPSF